MEHVPMEELEEGLETIRRSPREDGEVMMIVRRPGVEQREILEQGILDPAEGLVGDDWSTLAAKKSPNPDTQLTLMNSRVISLLAHDPDHQALAGDQLFVDLDLSIENLPAGTRLALGSAVIEVSARAHLGCDKFKARFGEAALIFVNSERGRQLRLRGLNARVVQAGLIRVGDVVKKIK
jgi:MOSC domain-containing protein YiiM